VEEIASATLRFLRRQVPAATAERACCAAQKTPAIAGSNGFRDAFWFVRDFAETRRATVKNQWSGTVLGVGT
jgi:hypothetical protein